MLLSFIFSQTSSKEARLASVLVVATVYLFIVSAGWEKESKSSILWRSLPMASWKIVAAKYLAGLLNLIFILPALCLLNYMLAYLGLTSVGISLLSIIVSTFIVILFAAIYWPTFFAFGYHGAWYWSLLIYVCSGILVVVSIELFLAKSEWLLTLWLSVGGKFLLSMAGVIFSTLLLAFSLYLSLKAYEKIEL